MTPISARSSSAYGTLITKAGQTFWVMPKSTCQTSPRSGTLRLLLVERPEHPGCQGGKIVVRQIVGHRHSLNDGAAQPGTLRNRELLDLGEDLSNGLSYIGSLNVACCKARLWVKAPTWLMEKCPMSLDTMRRTLLSHIISTGTKNCKLPP